MENPEKMQLDFSKLEDQERFSNLPKELQEAIIEKAHEDANTIKAMVDSGTAKNYSEALKKIDKLNFNEYDFQISIAENGDIFLDLGSGSSLVGNANEGVYLEKSEGVLEVDFARLDKNMEKILGQIDQLIGRSKGNA
jgi:hypothetical protein